MEIPINHLIQFIFQFISNKANIIERFLQILQEYDLNQHQLHQIHYPHLHYIVKQKIHNPSLHLYYLSKSRILLLLIHFGHFSKP